MISHKAFYIPNAVWHRCCIVWRAGLFALPKSLLTRLLWNSFRIVGNCIYVVTYTFTHPVQMSDGNWTPTPSIINAMEIHPKCYSYASCHGRLCPWPSYGTDAQTSIPNPITYPNMSLPPSRCMQHAACLAHSLKFFEDYEKWTYQIEAEVKKWCPILGPICVFHLLIECRDNL